MDKDTLDRLQNMQALESLIDGMHDGVRSPLNRLTDRVVILEQAQESFQEALSHVTDAVHDNTQRLDVIHQSMEALIIGQSEATQVNRESAELARQMLELQKSVKAVGRVSGMIGGFIPWLLKTNEGRGLALVAMAIYYGWARDLGKIKEWFAWLKF